MAKSTTKYKVSKDSPTRYATTFTVKEGNRKVNDATYVTVTNVYGLGDPSALSKQIIDAVEQVLNSIGTTAGAK